MVKRLPKTYFVGAFYAVDLYVVFWYSKHRIFNSIHLQLHQRLFKKQYSYRPMYKGQQISWNTLSAAEARP